MKSIPINSGDTFGRLVVISEVERRKKHRCFSCQCVCGNQTVAHLSALRSGLTTSCGCWRKEHATVHGQINSPTYRSWSHMVDRCSNPNFRGWKNYGGRGIRVCDRWKVSFAAFLADVGPRPSLKHSIDRYPDNNGNYEPGNVRWATMSEQHLNSRRSRSARGLA